MGPHFRIRFVLLISFAPSNSSVSERERHRYCRRETAIAASTLRLRAADRGVARGSGGEELQISIPSTYTIERQNNRRLG